MVPRGIQNMLNTKHYKCRCSEKGKSKDTIARVENLLPSSPDILMLHIEEHCKCITTGI